MIIQYLAHASFLITTTSGTRIVTDPFDPTHYPDKLLYKPFNAPADVITISHEHADHARPGVVTGTPVVIKGNGKFGAEDVEVRGIATYHDQEQGSQRGKNTVFVIQADGLTVAHMGDLGHVLTADQAAEIGAVDIALIPVGGYYTIDAVQAGKVAHQVSAQIVIPMHYRTEKCLFPIAGVEEFTEGKPNVTYVNSSTIEVTKNSLPLEQQIFVLDYSL